LTGFKFSNSIIAISSFILEDSDSFYFSLSILPVVVYSNVDKQKESIVKENRNKSGVYRWINNTNGNSYVGSSVNLSKRLLEYLNTNYLLRHKNMSINKALVKYGYSDFSLLILEYCEPDLCIEREQYYIDLYKPEYNILKLAGSSIGYTHTEETLAKLRDLEVSVERRALMSENFRGEKNPMFGRTGDKHPLFGQVKPEGSGRPVQRIEVLDLLTNEKLEYGSIGEAALAH
jgi:group I intron endonuclease